MCFKFNAEFYKVNKLGHSQGGKEAEEGKSSIQDFLLQLNITVNMFGKSLFQLLNRCSQLVNFLHMQAHKSNLHSLTESLVEKHNLNN